MIERHKEVKWSLPEESITGRLHTDVLEALYGPIALRLVHHDDFYRASHLVDKQGISRTYAVTFFTGQGVAPALQELDLEIRNSKPIGQTLRNHGYEVRKNVLDVSVITMPDWLKIEFQTESASAKCCISEYLAKSKDWGEPQLYGTVAEIYQPQFRPAEIEWQDRAQENPTLASLNNLGVSAIQLWDSLENPLPIEQKSYQYWRAFHASRMAVENVMERLMVHLKCANQ